MDLNEAEAMLKHALAGERLALSPELGEALDFDVFPAWMRLHDAIALERASVRRALPTRIEVAGQWVHPLFGSADSRLEIEADAAGTLESSLSLHIRNPVSLRDIAAAIGVPLPAPLSQLIDLVSVTSLALPRAAEVRLGLSGGPDLQLASIRARLALTELVLNGAGNGLEALSGELRLNNLTLPLTVLPDVNYQISVNAQGLTPLALLNAIGIHLAGLNQIPLLDNGFDAFRIIFDGDDLRIVATRMLAGVGTITLLVGRMEGEFGSAMLLDVVDNFRFSTISSVLGPLDTLLALVSFGDPALVLATKAIHDYPVQAAGAEDRRVDLAKGATVRGHLNLDGFGLDLLSSFLGLKTIPFEIPAVPDPGQIALTARLDREIVVFPGLTVRDLSVRMRPGPAIQTSAEAAARLSLFGSDLPELILNASLGPGDTAFSLRSAQPWSSPLGLPINIEQFGLQVAQKLGVIHYGFFGSVSLRTRRVDVAADFVGGAPTALVGSINGSVSMEALLKDLTGIDVPLMLQPELRDPMLYLVGDPAGLDIAGRHFSRGIAISGKMVFMGLEASLAINADVAHIQANGRLDRAIHIPPFLAISGARGDPTPSLSIDSSGDPVFKVSARVELLGLVQEVAGIARANGLELQLSQTVGPVAVRMTGTLSQGRFVAHGDAACQIKASIGPLRLFEGGPSLGKIDLDTGISAQTTVDISENGALRFTVSGKLQAVGIQIQLPDINVSTASFEQIPQAIVEYIRDNALGLFSDLLGNVDAWLKALAANLIREVDDVARALREQFNQNTEEIARAMRQTLADTIDHTTAALKNLGDDASKILQAMTAIGDSPDQVAAALVKIGTVPQEIAEALKLLNKPADEVQRVLERAGVPPDVVTGILTAVFPGSVSIPLPLPHINHVKVHVNHVKVHINHVKVHINHVKFF